MRPMTIERQSQIINTVLSGRYMVCENGDVHFPKHGKWQKFKQQKTGAGYRFVKIRCLNKSVIIMTHRLVYMIFNGPIPNNLEINHKNGLKADNSLCNLELVTRSQNILHASKNGFGFSGELNSQAKLTKENVLEIRRKLKVRHKGKYGSMYFAKKFGISHKTIHEINRNKIWRHLL